MAEPERADYQVDLAVSLAKLGALCGAEDRSLLGRALTLLVALRDANRLAPEHGAMIPALQELLGQREDG